MGDPLALNLVPFNTEPSLVFDAFDLDLVLKVLSNTAFSESLLNHPKLDAVQIAQLNMHSAGPFFTFFIPVLFLSQGQRFDVGAVFWSSIWFAVVTVLCSSRDCCAPTASKTSVLLTQGLSKCLPSHGEMA